VDDIAGRVGPVARQLLDYWRSLPARDFVPERHSFDPMAITGILPMISMLQRLGDDEWRFRLAGTEIERRWQRILTGANYLEIDIVSSAAADGMRREFQGVVGRPCGSWSQRYVRFQSGRAAVIETLRLPLRAADGGISLIVGCSEEFGDRTPPQVDAPCEIIRIAEQHFFDIGAGRPDKGALDTTRDDSSGPPFAEAD
jgi:hypothetical protein